MIWIIAWLCFLIGFFFHYLWMDFSPMIKEWRRGRAKFVCDACKATKRAKNGSTPLALDIDYGDELLPLNLRLCKDCAPDA